MKISPEDKKISSADMEILDGARALYQSDAQLAEDIGCSGKTISVWRSRGRLPQYIPQLLELLIARREAAGMVFGRNYGPSTVESGSAAYLKRIAADQGEARAAGGESGNRVPLIQLMAALRRIAAGQSWPVRSAVVQVLFAFDPEIRERWWEIREQEIEALRRLLSEIDVAGHGDEEIS